MFKPSSSLTSSSLTIYKKKKKKHKTAHRIWFRFKQMYFVMNSEGKRWNKNGSHYGSIKNAEKGRSEQENGFLNNCFTVEDGIYSGRKVNISRNKPKQCGPMFTVSSILVFSPLYRRKWPLKTSGGKLCMSG